MLKYNYLFRFVGDECELDIIRSGKEEKVKIILEKDNALIPGHPRSPPAGDQPRGAAPQAEQAQDPEASGEAAVRGLTPELG